MKIKKECLSRLSAITKSKQAKQKNLDIVYFDGKWLVACNGFSLYATTNHDIEESTPFSFKLNDFDKKVEDSRHLKRWRDVVTLPKHKISRSFIINKLVAKSTEATTKFGFDMHQADDGNRPPKRLMITGGNLALIAGSEFVLIADDQAKMDASIFAIALDKQVNATKMAVFNAVWTTDKTVNMDAPQPVPEPKAEPEPEPEPEPKPEPTLVPKPEVKKLKIVKDPREIGKREPRKKWNHLASLSKMESYWKSKLSAERRLKCQECGHPVKSEQEWIIATDLPYHIDAPLGTHDCGLFICPNPECCHFQRASVFDAECSTDEEGIKINLPWAKIREVFDNHDFLDTGIVFNPMQAAWNAIKYEVLEHFKSEEDDIFRAAMWPELYYDKRSQQEIWFDAVKLAEKANVK